MGHLNYHFLSSLKWKNKIMQPVATTYQAMSNLLHGIIDEIELHVVSPLTGYIILY